MTELEKADCITFVAYTSKKIYSKMFNFFLGVQNTKAKNHEYKQRMPVQSTENSKIKRYTVLSLTETLI